MAQQATRAAALAHLSPRIRRHLRALGFPDERSYIKWCKSSGFSARVNKNADQMKQEVRKKQSEATDSGRQQSLRQHIRNLGLDTMASYRKWCRKNGFGDGLHKSAAQRAKEVARLRAGTPGRATDHSRELRRNLLSTFRSMASGAIKRRDLTDPVLIRLHGLLQAHRDADTREAFLSLLSRADEFGVLIDVSPVIEWMGPIDGNTMLDALLALATQRAHWRRDVRLWYPASKSRNQAFGDLARHMIADFAVPSFMDSAWFAGTDGEAARQQSWFVHIGQGGNIRTADVPIRLTKRMAHLFIQAPATHSISHALRWAQVLGIGGDNELAAHINATRLGEHLEDDEFWVDVVHFFVNNPMLDYDQFGPIVDYIHNQRYVPSERRLADGTVLNEPPQPHFSMKGRTAERLLELVDRWHSQLPTEKNSRHSQWPESGISPFEKIEERNGHSIRWAITEITTRKGLLEEGRVMHHCVASYAPYCARGQKSVWSLSVEDRDTGYKDRVLTIAVQNATRRVVQARGRCNALPGVHMRDNESTRVLKAEGQRLKRGRAVMRQWGERESITVPRIT